MFPELAASRNRATSRSAEDWYVGIPGKLAVGVLYCEDIEEDVTLEGRFYNLGGRPRM